MTMAIDIMNDDGFEPAKATDENGVGKAWRKDLFMDMDRGIVVMVWKADVGIYASVAPPYAETFVVVVGTGEISIGDAPFEDIGPGSIVRMPFGAGMRLKVKTPYRMVATAVRGEPAA